MIVRQRFSLLTPSLVLAMFVLVGTHARALAAGDAQKGAKLYSKCVACHGKQAEGKDSQKAPRLAGQYDWYLVSQLNNFQKKIRLNPKMDPFIKNLSAQDFEDLAAYLSILEIAAAPAPAAK